MTTVVATLALMTTLSSGPDAPGRSFVAGQENPPAAQVAGPNDADAIRQRVKEGQKVRITDDQGREWHGRIEALAPDNLVLLTKDRQRRDIPYAAIVRIDRPHDTLANGALIGFVSGAVYGMLAVIAEENADCEPGAFFSCGDPTAAAYVLIPPSHRRLGARGRCGDRRAHPERPDVVPARRVSSDAGASLGRGVRGLSVSVRW